MHSVGTIASNALDFVKPRRIRILRIDQQKPSDETASAQERSAHPRCLAKRFCQHHARLIAHRPAFPMFTLSDFDFNLPPELIAQTALTERSASRLIDVNNRAATASFTDRHFTELPGLLEPGDLLVFNDTKVLKARFLG